MNTMWGLHEEVIHCKSLVSCFCHYPNYNVMLQLTTYIIKR